MVDSNEQAVVVVHGRGDGFAQEITAGRHRLIADEPVSAGGTDRGLGRTTCCWQASAPERP